MRFFDELGNMDYQCFFAPKQFGTSNTTIIKIKKNSIYDEQEYIMAGDRDYTLYVEDGFKFDDNIPVYYDSLKTKSTYMDDSTISFKYFDTKKCQNPRILKNGTKVMKIQKWQKV